MSANGILPVMDVRPSAVSPFIHPVTDKVSAPSWIKVSIPGWIVSHSFTARPRVGIGARIFPGPLAAAIDAYLKARRSDRTQRGERVTDHTISKELAVLRSALQRAKRLGKFFGDLDAVFPSTGEFAPGYDPRKSGAKALSREDVARLFAAAPREPAPDAPTAARETYRRTMGKLAVVAGDGERGCCHWV